MKTIILHGALGKLFGREWKLDVKTPAQAIRALCVLRPGFKKYMLEQESKGVTYNLRYNPTCHLGEDELQCGFSGDVLEIRPIVIGSKRQGLFQTILGAVLVVVGVFTTFFGDYSGSVIAAGIALMAGGISQMIFSPRLKLGNMEEDEVKRSYLFSGAKGTSRQGGPVPIGYGRMVIGPQVISAGLTNEDYFGSGSGGGGGTSIAPPSPINNEYLLIAQTPTGTIDVGEPYTVYVQNTGSGSIDIVLYRNGTVVNSGTNGTSHGELAEAGPPVVYWAVASNGAVSSAVYVNIS